MKELTKAEEQVMQVLWKLEKAFVKEILTEFEEPKPAYNTISTIIRILEQKKIVDHEEFGNSYRYFPLITKEEYTKKFMRNFVGKYFSDSYKQLVSFFAREEKLTVDEMEELKKMLEEEIDKRKEQN
jgi:BlaI family penicillinase repressor